MHKKKNHTKHLHSVQSSGRKMSLVLYIFFWKKQNPFGKLKILRWPTKDNGIESAHMFDI